MVRSRVFPILGGLGRWDDRAEVQRHVLVPGLGKSVSIATFFFFQFNYMHECFERVFCELKWRKEVILQNSRINFFIFLFKMYRPMTKYWDPHLHFCLSRNIS